MSAVLERAAGTPATARSPGVWAAAWQRLKEDRVGLGALAVVLAFFLLILSSAVGVTAADWQLEKGVPYAFPRFIGERENVEAQAMAGISIARDRTPIDISDVDPLAPRYREWAERTAKISLADRTIVAACVIAMSISFLVYIIFGQYVFGFLLGWLPVQGWSDQFLVNLLKYAPLPVMLAVFVSLAPQTRLYRTFFLDEINHDYVRTARAKGLSERMVMLKHVLRNAMIPILTNVAVQLPSIFVGSFLIEVFFSIPGLGREVFLAVNRSDYPVIQAVTIYLAVLTMLINLGADLLYRLVDPRVVLR